MLESPFAFFRGAAPIMAADLATTPRTGIDVQLCGDAHLANFGGFASPDRDLVFSINDFDETLPGPWEWDVKRLAVSTVVAGHDRGFSGKQRRSIVLGTVRQYRDAMREFAGQRDLAVWYARLDATEILERSRSQASAKSVRSLRHSVAKAHRRDSVAAFSKLTHDVDGERRIISDPPMIVPIEELLRGDDATDVERISEDHLRLYRDSLPGDRRHLVDRFRYAHLARKVVGVGSVGTRDWIVLLLGRDGDDPLFLQIKEASASALTPYLAPSEFDNQGQRIVEGQRLMQAASDIFLGWLRSTGVDDGVTRDFYVRQLWDWKMDADIRACRRAECTSTAERAAGHWRERMLAPETALLLRPISVRMTRLRMLSLNSPSRTLIRTNATTAHWAKPSRRDASSPTNADSHIRREPVQAWSGRAISSCSAPCAAPDPARPPPRPRRMNATPTAMTAPASGPATYTQ